MTTHRYSRQTYYLIAAFIVFIALLWTAANTSAQDETATPVVNLTPEPTAEPDTPAPSPEEVTSAGIGFGAALIIAFLTGGVSFGGIVLWARADPTRIKQLEMIGDSLPSHVGNRLIELGNTAITIMAKFTEALELMIEATDRVPLETKAQSVQQSEGKVVTTTTTEISGDVDGVEPPREPVG